VARADLLVALIRAATAGDDALLRRTVEAMIAEERAKHHHVLADRLSGLLAQNGAAAARRSTSVPDDVNNFLLELVPRKTFSDLLLPENVISACQELVEEHHRADLLRSHNLEPRHRVLLVGPPGNGKTSLAEALAEALIVPFIVIRYEGIIGSYLGETASRLHRAIEYARTRQCVLFFDEFDVIGKERGDTHETGEIKRVVSSLLLQLDALPSYVTVITASNHPELLDRAVWRRFQLRLFLPRPTEGQFQEWFEQLEHRVGQKIGVPLALVARRLGNVSFAELEDFALDVQRKLVLRGPGADARSIVRGALEQWQGRVEPVRTGL
jgi:SpoVK/Ycf46/Vps4 family AAA+-type ATPase